MKHLRIPITAGAALFSLGLGSAGAQVLFSESFDDEATAAVLTDADSDTVVTYVDYSDFDVGSTNHAIPEAPGMVDGSAETRGVLVQANLLNGAPAAVRLFAADGPGGEALTFDGNYKLNFDMFLSVANPIPSGGTEVGLFGLDVDPALPYAYPNRSDFSLTGTWGWISTESGIGTSGDSTIYVDGFPLGVYESNSGTRHPKFVEAFSAGAPDPFSPNGHWVQVEISRIDDEMTLRYNGITFFPEDIDPPLPVDASAATGAAMLGYGDAFGSISGSPDFQWGLFDNMVVSVAFPATIDVRRTEDFQVTTDQDPMSSTATYEIENLNDTDLTVSAVNLSGDDAAAFSTVTPLPIVVAPGGTGELEVMWTPSLPTGEKSAVMELVSDDPNEPSLKFGLGATFSPAFVRHHKFDEVEAGDGVIDSSGNGLDGIFAENTPATYGLPALAAGTAVRLEESIFVGGGGSTGNFAILPAGFHTPSMTLSIWVQPELDTSDTDVIVSRNSDGGDSNKIWGLYVDGFDESLVFSVGDGFTDGFPVVTSSPGAIEDGETYHIAVTQLDEDGFGNDTATRTRLYINGAMVAEATGFNSIGFPDYPPTATERRIFVATAPGAGSGYTGVVDDLQFYSLELSEAQIASLFNNPGSTAFEPVEEGPFEIIGFDYDATIGDAELTWTSAPGKTYLIQYSDDLEMWMDGPDGIASGGATTSATVSGNLGTPDRAFRVMEE